MLICRMQCRESEEEGGETGQLRMGCCCGLLEGGGEVWEWDEEGVICGMYLIPEV